MAMTTTFRAGLVVVALVLLACGSPSSTASPSAGYTVVARWASDDGSIVALNVVVGPGRGPRELADIANELRERDPGSRVIVTFFAEWAGPERFVVGHVPAGREPLAVASRAPSWLWTADTPPLAPRPT